MYSITKMRGVACALMTLAFLSASAQGDPVDPEPAGAKDTMIEKPVVAASTGEGALPELTKADIDAWLDGFIPYAIAKGDIVGAQATVVKDSQILTSRGFGYSDIENKIPVDGYKTLFRPGSISKLFTWISVMQQVENGNIDLDEDINTYLDFEIPVKFDAPITMRNLMTHTPGFQEKFKNLIIGDPDLYMSLEEFLKSSPPPARIFPPGETPAYSNYGTALAGYIVQRLSGEPFEAYVERHIFEPLGMEVASFRQPLPAKFESRMSRGYRSASHGEAQYYELVPMAPAGSLAADGEAMGRFMIGLLARDPSVMKPETWTRMYETIHQFTPPLNAMALGFWELDKGNLAIRGHGGDTIFFHSDLNVILDKNVGIYVSVNSTGEAGGTLRFAVTAGFAERYFSEAAVPVGPRLETAKEHGALVSGVYESSRTVATNFAAVVRYLGQETISINEDGDIVFSLLGTPSIWREVEPFVWQHTEGYERFAAAVDEQGRVNHVTFEPVSPIIHLLPAPLHRSSAIWTPLLATAVGVLALTLVSWPVRAVVRRRFQSAFLLTGKERLAYRTVRIGIALVFVFLVAWVVAIQTLFTNLSGLSAAFSAQLRVTQFAQIFLYLAAAGAVWNVTVVWRSNQSRFAKLWSLVLTAAIVVVILFAGFNGLLSWESDF